MFDDSQTAQGAQTSNDNTAGTTVAPAFGLGVNPTLISPTDSTAQQSTAPSAPIQEPEQEQLAAPASTPDSNSLNDIKRHALEQLSPLVHQLEQTPEEKYKTLMMMIQASDNQELISEAYAAAQQITDEKAKAEALLNIVNEINYFTQKSA